MSFSSFLNESNVNSENLVDFLKNNAGPLLRENPKLNQSNLPFRGVRDVYSGFIEIKTRTDRRPTDTPLEIHKLFDNFLEKKFGKKYRSQAVFATYNEEQSDAFGIICNVLPLGEYSIVYSPVISDIIEQIKPLNNLVNEIKHGVDFVACDPEFALRLFQKRTSKAKSIFTDEFIFEALVKAGYEKKYNEIIKNKDEIIPQSSKKSFDIPKFKAGAMFYLAARDIAKGHKSDFFEKILDNFGYEETKNLEKVRHEAKGEIMISCDSYLIWQASAMNFSALKIALEELQK